MEFCAQSDHEPRKHMNHFFCVKCGLVLKNFVSSENDFFVHRRRTCLEERFVSDWGRAAREAFLKLYRVYKKGKG